MRKGILAIGGIDPTGSAGLLLDVSLIKRYGIAGMGIATEMVYENTCRVMGMTELSVKKQYELIRKERVKFTVIKIGAVYDRTQLYEIEELIEGLKPSFVVIDPIFKASSGRSITHINPAHIRSFVKALKDVETILMPNAKEFILIAENRKPQTLAVNLNTWLIIKGHEIATREATDLLITPRGVASNITHRRYNTDTIHGTGCLLSTLLAIGLYQKKDVHNAYTWAIKEFGKYLRNNVFISTCQRLII